MRGLLQIVAFLLCVIGIAGLVAGLCAFLSVLRWRKYGGTVVEHKRGAWGKRRAA